MKKSSKTIGKVNRGAEPQPSQETIGIDLGDKVSQYCVLNDEGGVIEEGSFRNTDAGLKKRFGALERTRIALESGTQSGWISRVLVGLGHEALVVNARELYGISRSDRKNDRNDAEKLARYARLDPALLHPIQHRTEQQELDLGMVRARDALGRARALLVNAARGLAKVHGQRLPASITATFGRRAKQKLAPELAQALHPLLAQIDSMAVQIGRYDTLLEEVAQARYPETERLRSVPGVGPVTALTFVLTLSDAKRFRHSRDVGPYLGLQPKQRQSGERDPQLGISKAGNGYLRKLLVQCAHHTLGSFGVESRVRQWGHSLSARGGSNAKKRAIVAVARKLAVLLHKLWASGELYQPFYGEAVTSAANQ